MATKIRLKRMGKIRNPQYRVIVIDERAKRDGRAIEEIGTYQPKADPSIIDIKSERVQYWLGVGAQPSETVQRLLVLTGDWQKFKGTDEPSGVKPQPEKADKLAAFNKALAESDDEPASGAITRKKAKDADAETAEDAPTADDTTGAPAEAEASTDAPAEAEASTDEA